MNRKFISLITGGFIAVLGVLAPMQHASARFVPGEGDSKHTTTPPEEIERKIQEKKSRSQQQSTTTPSNENDDNPTSPDDTVNNSNKESDNASDNTEDVSENQEINKLGGWEWLAAGALGVVALAGVGWVVMGRRKR